jgi:hypothetical protein
MLFPLQYAAAIWIVMFLAAPLPIAPFAVQQSNPPPPFQSQHFFAIWPIGTVCNNTGRICDYTTISAAIIAAQPNDIILVEEGAYPEPTTAITIPLIIVYALALSIHLLMQFTSLSLSHS